MKKFTFYTKVVVFMTLAALILKPILSLEGNAALLHEGMNVTEISSSFDLKPLVSANIRTSKMNNVSVSTLAPLTIPNYNDISFSTDKENRYILDKLCSN